MTYEGGANNAGTIFEFNPSTGIITKKYDFTSSPDGYNPRGSFEIDNSGIAYAMTYTGGTANAGTIFKYNTVTDSVQKLVDFNSSDIGFAPFNNLIQANDGNIYGSTSAGGKSGNGVLYKFNPNTSQYTIIKDFSNVNDGKYPSGSIIQASDGNLYGTAQSGGMNSYGVIYKYNPSNQTFTNVYNFDNTNGRLPNGAISEGSNGVIYGTTFYGGLGYGVLYSFKISSGTYLKLYEFYTDGYYPQSGVLAASNGNIYGTTTYGGVGNNGVLFEYDTQSSTYSKINTPGVIGRLMQASDGNIYGTCYSGGPNYGFILKYNPDSATYYNIFNFTTSANGINPGGAVSEIFPNKLFGTTNAGGANFKGVFYEYNLTNSSYTILNHLTSGIGFDTYSAFAVASAASQITNSINAISCNSYVSPSGNYIWYNSGVYLDTLQTGAGIDSILTIHLTIINSPTVSITSNLSSSYCSAAGSLSLTANPSGGIFSGPGVSGNSFSPSWANTGNNQIIYTFTDTNGCHGSDTVNIQVNSQPTVVITSNLNSSYCANAASFALSATPSGGIFSGPGVNNNIFNTGQANIGLNTIVYTYSDANGCSGSDSIQTTINSNPVVSFTSPSNYNYCENADSVLMTANPTGGSFSGTGVIGNYFHPTMAQLGINTMYYSYTDSNGCTSGDNIYMNILASPTVQITSALDTSYCSNHNSLVLTAYPFGGNYSGQGILGNIFNPQTANVGFNTIKYSYTNSNGCSGSDSLTVKVNAAPTVTITSSLNPTYCNSASSVSLTASPSGGVFTGSGVVADSFNPSTANLGANHIIYSYSDANGCLGKDTVGVMVFAQPNVIITSNISAGLCKNSPSVNLSGYPSGGIFSGPGISGQSFSPSNANTGLNQIVYNFTDANSCSNSDTINILVNNIPIVNFGSQSDICLNANSAVLSNASPTGGIFSGNGVNSAGIFYPAVAGIGSHNLVYSFTDGNGCTDTAQATIRVISVPTATFTVNSTVCISNSTSINYTGTSGSSAIYTWNFDNASIWSGSGVGPYSLSWSQAGIKQLSLSVTDSGCTSNTTLNYTNVLSSYADIIAVGNTTVCFGDSVTLFANIGIGNQFQWYDTSGILIGDTGSYINVGNSGSFFCQVTTSTGCPSYSDTIGVVIKNQIIADFTIPSTACQNDIVAINFNGIAPVGANYNWNFDSGNIASGSGSGPFNIIWNIDSIQTVSLQITEGNCSSTLTEKNIIILSTPASITTLGSKNFCDGNSVTLSANAGPNSYEWFKNGTTTGITSALLNATQSGNYAVKITNNQTNCNALSDTVTITVNTTDFNLAFTANPVSFTIPPFNTTITNQTAGSNDFYWSWSFGDGQTSSNVNPTHQYLYDGTYTVQVIAQKISTGCVDTLTKSNYISCTGGTSNPCNLNNAIGHIGSNIICPTDSVKLFAKEHGTGVTYQWLKDGVLIGGKTDSVLYASQTGFYQLMVADNSCSVFSQPFSLTVRTTITPVILTNGNIQPCTNDSMELYVNTSFSGYQWSNGATSPGIFVKNSGNYFVTVTDNYGCHSVSLPKTVNASIAQAPEICIVGVDSATNSNRIIWERHDGNLLDSFRIYRETSTAGVYALIGSQPFSSHGLFIDTNSNPTQQAYRYQVTAIDSCGMETSPGIVHKTIHLTINAGLNDSWNLIWSHYKGFTFGSYRIYRGTDSTQMQLLTQIQSTLNSYTDLNPPAGKVYYQIEIVSPHPCYPDSIFSKAQTNYNTSRSNKVNTSLAPNIGFEKTNTNTVQLRLYPNPNNGNFNLEIYDKSKRNIRLNLLNAIGSVIYTDDFESNGLTIKQINVTNLPSGIYFIQLNSTDGTIYGGKFIID